jgi:hypothetical protein
MSNLGEDFECADDITADWALAKTPEDAFIQACYRRLTLSNLWYSEDDYGRAVESFLADVLTEAQMSQEIERELLKDERTLSVAVTWANSEARIAVTPHDGDTFTLTLDTSAEDIADALQLPEAS